MGEKWRELKSDPLMRDLAVIVADGLSDFSDEKLTTLPTLLGQEGKPAERSEIRRALIDVLMYDEPGKTPGDFDTLGQSTRFGLTLLGATPATRMLATTGRREAAGKIYRDRGLSADAIRRRPSAKQPKGGQEWRLLLGIRERLLEMLDGPPAPVVSPDTQTLATTSSAEQDGGPSLAGAFFVEGYVYNSSAFRMALSGCQTLSLLGYSHNRMAVTYASELSHLMERGGRLRVLALDPRDPITLYANLRSYAPKEPEAVRHQHEAAIATLTAIGTRASEPSGFELRLMDCTPPFTIYLFDEDDGGRAQVFVWLTPWRVPSPERPGFRLTAARDRAWYHFFADQLSAMWSNFEARA